MPTAASLLLKPVKPACHCLVQSKTWYQVGGLDVQVSDRSQAGCRQVADWSKISWKPSDTCFFSSCTGHDPEVHTVFLQLGWWKWHHCGIHCAHCLLPFRIPKKS